MMWVFSAWGRILRGYRPALSVEITRECPLRCPGCYAYQDQHLGGEVTLRQVADYKGDELVTRFMELIDEHKPVHVSIIGGEPLVQVSRAGRDPAPARRSRDFRAGGDQRGAADPGGVGKAETAPDRRLDRRSSTRARRATNAGDLRPDPEAHRRTPSHRPLHGHAPAGTARRLSRRVRQSVVAKRDCQAIWTSLYTPQIGEVSEERLRPEDRQRVVASLMHLRPRYPKLRMPAGLIQVYANPPQTPQDCVFAQTTTCLSADFKRQITPCQFGGNPDCANCGCIASAGLGALGRHRLPGGVRVETLFKPSLRIGDGVRRLSARWSDPHATTSAP